MFLSTNYTFTIKVAPHFPFVNVSCVKLLGGKSGKVWGEKRLQCTALSSQPGLLFNSFGEHKVPHFLLHPGPIYP